MKTQKKLFIILSMAIAGPVMAQPPTKRTVERSTVDRLREQLQGVEASLGAIEKRLGRSAFRQRSSELKIEGSESGNQLLKRERARYWDVARQNYEIAPPVARDPFGANADVIRQHQDKINKLKANDSKLKGEYARCETEQSLLWARISAAVIREQDISDRKEYYYAPFIRPTDASSEQDRNEKIQAAEALIRHLRTIDASIAAFDEAIHVDQVSAYEFLRVNFQKATQELMDGLRPMSASITDKVVGLKDSAKRINESTGELSLNIQKASSARLDASDSTRMLVRKQLRELDFSLADQVLELDRGIIDLFEKWKVRPQLDKRLEIPSIIKTETKVAQHDQDERTEADPPEDEGAGEKDSETAESPPSEHPRQPSSSSKGAKVIDLIATANSQNGGWKRMPDGGVAIDNQGTYIMRPAPNGEYDIQLSFTMTQQWTNVNDIVNLGLWHRNRFSWVMGPRPGGKGSCGFSRINEAGYAANNTTRSFDLSPNKRNDIEIKVRNKGLEAYVNGALICQYSTDYSDLSKFGMDPGTALKLQTGIPLTIHSAKLIIVSGGDSPPPSPTKQRKQNRGGRKGRRR